ncbi:hypothetical protein ACOSP7_025546 [Xanthoceras sorbifolium]
MQAFHRFHKSSIITLKAPSQNKRSRSSSFLFFLFYVCVLIRISSKISREILVLVNGKTSNRGRVNDHKLFALERERDREFIYFGKVMQSSRDSLSCISGLQELSLNWHGNDIHVCDTIGALRFQDDGTAGSFPATSIFGIFCGRDHPMLA